MASFHTLLSRLNDMHPCTEFTSKIHGSDAVGALSRRLRSAQKRKCMNFDNFRGYTPRASRAGHIFGSSDTMEVSIGRETPSKVISGQNQIPRIEIPVTCYQIIGLNDRAEKDEIVKSVMHLKNAEIEEEYTKDTVRARQDLLMDVRDKLLFEPEYAGNIKDKQPPKSSLCLPWNWLPSALCLLQEVGEEKLVLEIGLKALQNSVSKPFAHDLLLSLALAECAIAKSAFEKTNIPQGFEALARAQCLLRSKNSLAKAHLLSQIVETLEDLAPACTLDLLGLPQMPENAERRTGAVAALRELLRQGLDVESSCRVQDWPSFLSQALKKLMAIEIVELISWEGLALIRKNRKSLESQNQRIVIDFNSFYIVMLAHIALGFSCKQTDLIKKAKTICECLIASEGVDLKLEDVFCSFLLGQGDEAAAVENLRQLQQGSRSVSQNMLQFSESREASNSNKSLETWLKESVLALFPDTRVCSSSLNDFFKGYKTASESRMSKRTPPMSNLRHRQIAVALPRDHRDGESIPSVESSQNLGSAVKQLAFTNMQNSWTEPQQAKLGSNAASPSVQLKRSLIMKHEIWKQLLSISHMLGKIMYSAAVGCILVALFKSLDMRGWRLRNVVQSKMFERSLGAFSPARKDSHLDLSYKNFTRRENPIVTRLKKALSLFHRDCQESSDFRTASVSSGLTKFMASALRQPAPFEIAESLVRQWQAVKARALGPDHDIFTLDEILEGSMLVQWQALAKAAKSKSCFWRFVLLQLDILHAETLMDGAGMEMLEIEVMLEEAAELVGENQPKNPTYYSPYRIRYLLKRQEDGSWRFCECEILTAS